MLALIDQFVYISAAHAVQCLLEDHTRRVFAFDLLGDPLRIVGVGNISNFRGPNLLATPRGLGVVDVIGDASVPTVTPTWRTRIMTAKIVVHVAKIEVLLQTRHLSIGLRLGQ